MLSRWLRGEDPRRIRIGPSRKRRRVALVLDDSDESESSASDDDVPLEQKLRRDENREASAARFIA